MPVTIMADSRSSINILDEKEYRRLHNRPKLEPSSVKMYGYQSKVPLRVLGKFLTKLESETNKMHARFYVVKGSSGSLHAQLEDFARAESMSDSSAIQNPTFETGSRNTLGSTSRI